MHELFKRYYNLLDVLFIMFKKNSTKILSYYSPVNKGINAMIELVAHFIYLWTEGKICKVF